MRTIIPVASSLLSDVDTLFPDVDVLFPDVGPVT